MVQKNPIGSFRDSWKGSIREDCCHRCPKKQKTNNLTVFLYVYVFIILQVLCEIFNKYVL